jgi:hypothetical protein
MLELFVSLQTFIAGRQAEIEERGATAVEYALMVGLIDLQQHLQHPPSLIRNEAHASNPTTNRHTTKPRPPRPGLPRAPGHATPFAGVGVLRCSHDHFV